METKTKLKPEVKEVSQEIIEGLMALQRKRQGLIKMMNRQRSQVISYLAVNVVGYSSFDAEKARAKRWGIAEKLYKAIVKGNPLPKGCEAMKESVSVVSLVKNANRYMNDLTKQRKILEKQMSKEVEALPILQWWLKHRGLGNIGLASIIGEAGDLADYANPAKLWKRFGLAVMEGIRQGGLRKTAAKELWIEHGYNPRRRSVIWTIGDSLLKNNGGGRYKTLYDERKDFEHKKLLAKHIQSGETEDTYKPGHAHNRAKRYMEKRLLRDLWNKWNDTEYANN